MRCHRWVVVLTSLACGIAVTRLYRVSDSAPDFRVYRDSARAAWSGIDVYRLAASGGGADGNPFTYPPVAALLFRPAACVPWRVGYLVLGAASMLALAWTLGRFRPLVARGRCWVVPAAIVLAGTTRVLMTNIGYGQINLLLMALCLADLARREETRFGRLLPRGALVGLAAAIKLTPGLFIVYFAASGQWRLARNAVVSALGATVIGALAFPAMTISFFGHAIWRLTDRVDLDHPVGYWGNNSIYGALSALGGCPAAVAVPVVLGTAGLCVAAAVRLHRRRAEAEAWLVVGLTAPVISTFSWTHHYVYLLPALFRLAPGLRRGRSVVAGAVVVFCLHWSPGVGERWLRTGSPLLAAPGVLMRESLVLLSLACILRLSRVRPAGPAAPGSRWTGRPRSLRRRRVLLGDRLLEPLAGVVQPPLADVGERLAALPQRERLLE